MDLESFHDIILFSRSVIRAISYVVVVIQNLLFMFSSWFKIYFLCFRNNSKASFYLFVDTQTQTSKRKTFWSWTITNLNYFNLKWTCLLIYSNKIYWTTSWCLDYLFTRISEEHPVYNIRKYQLQKIFFAILVLICWTFSNLVVKKWTMFKIKMSIFQFGRYLDFHLELGNNSYCKFVSKL